MLIFLRQEGLFHLAANHGFSREFVEWTKLNPISPGPGTITGRAEIERRTIHIHDVLADAGYTTLESQARGGYRSALEVPLLRDGIVIGSFVLTRPVVKPFTEKQIELVSTFADQAVIAIENARLFTDVQARSRELQESLEFRARRATCSTSSVVRRRISSLSSMRSSTPPLASVAAIGRSSGSCTKIDTTLPRSFATPRRSWPNMRAPIRSALAAARSSAASPSSARPFTFRTSRSTPNIDGRTAGWPGSYTMIGVPLLHRGTVIGVIAVHRRMPQPFSQREIDLVTTFADQAVIAIENVRLFEEVQARTRELQESLEYQTATSDVLNVISRAPSQLQPVFDAIVETAARLCEADYAVVHQLRSGTYHVVSANSTEAEYVNFLREHPMPPDRGSVVGRTALEGRTVHLPDCLEDPEYTGLGYQRSGGFRTILGVPLLRDGMAIGVITLLRNAVRPFAEKQIELVTTFADQAVIAIENVRLFDEVQTRTHELSVALEQQTATSEVLQAISSSTGDVQPVFQTMLENATRICDAKFGSMSRYTDGKFYTIAHLGVPPAFAENLLARPRLPLPGTALERIVATKKTVHIADMRAEQSLYQGNPQRRATADLGGARTFVAVPMLKDGELIGVSSAFTVRRSDRLRTSKSSLWKTSPAKR